MAKKKRRAKPTERRPIHLNIAALRKAKGFSQSQLAEKLGLDETSVSHWETGRSSPTGKRLDLVAELLGVTVPDLFREEMEAA